MAVQVQGQCVKGTMRQTTIDSPFSLPGTLSPGVVLMFFLQKWHSGLLMERMKFTTCGAWLLSQAPNTGERKHLLSAPIHYFHQKSKNPKPNVIFRGPVEFQTKKVETVWDQELLKPSVQSKKPIYRQLKEINQIKKTWQNQNIMALFVTRGGGSVQHEKPLYAWETQQWTAELAIDGKKVWSCSSWFEGLFSVLCQRNLWKTMGEEDGSTSCGLGTWRPRWMQRFASRQVRVNL